MTSDISTSQTALVVIATAVSIQTLVMLASAWSAFRAWHSARAEVERHMNLLQLRVEVLADAARHLVTTVDHGADRVSAVFTSGERIAGSVGSAVARPQLVLASLAGKLASQWRSRRASRQKR